MGSALVYFLLYVYVDTGQPQDTGVSQDKCFCLSPSFWCPPKQKPSSQGDVENQTASPLHTRSSRIQEVVDTVLLEKFQKDECVVAEGLEVVFTGVQGEEIRAVDGLNLVMYTGEIFVLLGHNGAGKTTTIGVLTGMVRSTGGSVKVLGKRIPRELSEVRKNLGLCPQHNLLWDEMTCMEHMHFYMRLRGTSTVNEQIALALLKDVDLETRVEALTNSLSGGMKRKLSVAIAFNGEPDLVILDEPTSGLDPFSRRLLWNFIKHHREDKVVLLTTHFMDEADVLGDRLAIMAHGQLQTYGDAQFLKRRFGSGYVVTVVMEEQVEVSREKIRKELRDRLMKELADVEGLEISSVGKEVTIQVPFTSSMALPKLFKLLNSERRIEKPDGLVASYGVSVSSLEDVFLKIASGNIDKVDKDEPLYTKETKSNREEVILKPGLEGRISVGKQSTQMTALLKRRYKMASRDLKTFCLLFLIPPLILLVGLLYLQSQANVQTPSVSIDGAVPKYSPDRVLWASTAMHRIPNISDEQYIIFNEKDIETARLTQPNEPDDGNFFSGQDFTDLFQTRSSYVNGGNVSVPSVYSSKLCDMEPRTFSRCQDRWTRHLALFATKVKERGGEWDAGVLLIDGMITVWANATLNVHSVPMAVNSLHQTALAAPPSVITGVFQEPQQIDSSGPSYKDFVKYVFPVGLLVFALVLFPVSVMSVLMMERATGTKSQLLISGCTYLSYWFSNLLWDVVYGVFPVILAGILLWALSFDAFTHSLTALYTVMLLFLPGAAGLAYVFTQTFSSDTIA